MSIWQPTGKTVKDSRGQWLLVCSCLDCGRLANRRHDRINKHCSKCRPSHPDAARRNGYRRYKAGAKNRDYIFDLTFDEWCEITSQDCYYCGDGPSNKVLSCKRDLEYVYNGIDRVDNNVGYTTGNCVPCCFQCNKAKMAMSVNQFITMCKKVSERHV